MRFMARNMIFVCVWKRGIVGNMVILIRSGHSQAYARSMLVLESEARHAMTYTGNDDIRSWFPFCRPDDLYRWCCQNKDFPRATSFYLKCGLLWIYPPYIQQIPTVLLVLSQQKPSERAQKGAQKGAPHCNWLHGRLLPETFEAFPCAASRSWSGRLRPTMAGGPSRWMWVSLYGLCVCKGMCICKYMSLNKYIYIYLFVMCKYVYVYL